MSGRYLLALGIAIVAAFAVEMTRLGYIPFVRHDRCYTDSNYKSAKTSLLKAERWIAVENYGEASKIMDAALERLGNSYYVLSNDDTGLNLSIARYEWQKKNFKGSMALKREALESRLDMFEFKYCGIRHH